MAERRIVAVALANDGGIGETSLETAALAREYGRRTGGRALAVALGHEVEEPARDFARSSGLDTTVLSHPGLADYTAQGWLGVLAGWLGDRPASLILIPHTSRGWDFAPALAARLGADCLTGISGLDEGDPPGFIRPILSGKLLARTSLAPDRGAVITVLAGAAKAEPADAAGRVTVIQLDHLPLRGKNLGTIKAPPASLDLTRARVIVAAGRGVGAPEKLELVRELAGCFEHAAVGASRPVVDAGWLGLEHQVGQTGRTVRPRLYVALGISGALQHTAGMKDSELIVAVNRDRGAAIFKVAHLGVAADLHRFVPLLIEELRSRQGG